MPKAGSTVLQERLKVARDRLRKRRVLYPGRGLNHNFLTAGIMRPDELPRIFRQHYEGREQAIAAEFAEFWDDIRRKLAKVSPAIVILSAEAIWTLRSRHAPALRRLLGELTDEIEILVYARSPSDFYLSAAQQALKASHQLPKVGSIKYRASIEALEAVSPNVRVVQYDRGAFPGGDICADFAHRCLGDVGDALEDEGGAAEANVSLSAEAMAVVQGYRQQVHADRQHRFTRDTGTLMNTLRRVEREARPRPALRADIRERIDHASPDLLWLRDRFGIVFAGIDYERLVVAPPWRPERVRDVCVVDGEEQDALMLRAFGDLLRDQAEEAISFRTVYKPRGGGKGRRDVADAEAT